MPADAKREPSSVLPLVRRADFEECLKWYDEHYANDADHVNTERPIFVFNAWFNACACGELVSSHRLIESPVHIYMLASEILPSEDADVLPFFPILLDVSRPWPWHLEDCAAPGLGIGGGSITARTTSSAGLPGGGTGLSGGLGGGTGLSGGLGGGTGLFGLGDLDDRPVDVMPSPVPLPAAGLMFPAGVAALVFLGWLRRRSVAAR